MNSLIRRLRNEPVLVTTLVSAVLVLLVAFGVPLTDGQTAAVVGVVVAAMALVTRSKVVPKRKVHRKMQRSVGDV